VALLPNGQLTQDENLGPGLLQAEVSYEYMRGTTDEGNYLTPSRVIINKRKMGSLAVPPPPPPALTATAMFWMQFNGHITFRNWYFCRAQPHNCSVFEWTPAVGIAKTRLIIGFGGCQQSGEAHFPAEPLAAVPRQCLAAILHLLWYFLLQVVSRGTIPCSPFPACHCGVASI